MKNIKNPFTKDKMKYKLPGNLFRETVTSDLRGIDHIKKSIETNGCATILLNSERKILVMNQEFCNDFGFNRKEAEGSLLLDEILTEKDRDRMLAYHYQRRNFSGFAPTCYSAQLKDSRNRKRVYLINVHILHDKDTSVLSAFEITHIRKQERMLRKKLRFEKGLSRAAKHALASKNFQEFYQTFPKLLYQYFGCNYISVTRIQHPDSPPDSIFRWFKEQKDDDFGFPNFSRKSYRYIWKRFFSERDISILPDDKHIPKEILTRFHKLNIYSMAVIPVYENDQYCGHVFLGTPYKNAEWIHKDISVIKMASFIIGSFVQKQQYLELLQKKNRLNRFIIDAMSDGFCLFENDIIIETNPSFCVLTGYSEQEIVGKKMSDFEIGEKIYHQSAVKKSYETQFLKKDGNLIWAEIRYSDENTLYQSAFIRDITDKKSREQNEKIRLEELAHASKMAAVGTLVAGVAHEINNPNNCIILNSQLLKKLIKGYLKDVENSAIKRNHSKKNKISEYQKDICDLLEGIHDGGMRIYDLVQDLKCFYQKDIPEKIEVFNVNDAVTEAVRLMKAFIYKTIGNFNLNLSENLPNTIGSMRRIQQVVINLLQNSCDAITSREQIISISTEYNRIKNEIILTVSDQGIGIPTESLHRITEPFFTTRRTEGGTGLGLSISHTIIKEHDGTMEFFSESGKGTSVKIRIPIKR